MDNTRNSVLIIDDEDINLDILNVILEEEYTTYKAKDGRSAIDIAGKYLPDLILLDIILPDINGFEVLTELKNNEKTKDIPVIFITGIENIGAEEKGLELGAVDFINKPFSTKIVKLKVRNQIRTIIQLKELKKLKNKV